MNMPKTHAKKETTIELIGKKREIIMLLLEKPRTQTDIFCILYPKKSIKKPIFECPKCNFKTYKPTKFCSKCKKLLSKISNWNKTKCFVIKPINKEEAYLWLIKHNQIFKNMRKEGLIIMKETRGKDRKIYDINKIKVKKLLKSIIRKKQHEIEELKLMSDKL